MIQPTEGAMSVPWSQGASVCDNTNQWTDLGSKCFVGQRIGPLAPGTGQGHIQSLFLKGTQSKHLLADVQKPSEDRLFVALCYCPKSRLTSFTVKEAKPSKTSSTKASLGRGLGTLNQEICQPLTALNPKDKGSG